MRGKRTPAKRRAEAAGIALMDGPTEAARQTGIPESTIRGWLDSEEFAQLRERKTEEVAQEWWAGIQKAFRRSVELLDKTDDPVKAATAGAIMFDKMALRSGEVTSRTETRTWTDTLNPDQQRQLRDWALDRIDELRGGTGVHDPAAEGAGIREQTAG